MTTTRQDNTKRDGLAALLARRRWLTAVIAVAVLLGSGAVLLEPGSTVLQKQHTPGAFVYRWPAGKVYTYQVALRLESTLSGDTSQGTAPKPVMAALALEGELALRSYGRIGPQSDYVLGVRFNRFQRLDWTFGKNPILVDGGRSLVGCELKVVVSPDGTVRSLNVSRNAPHRLVNLLRQVLAQLEVVVAPGEHAWTRRQTNPVGDVHVGYQIRENQRDVLVLRRQPLRYTRLAAGAFLRSKAVADPTGAYEVALDRAGHLKTLTGHEEVDATGANRTLGFRQRTRIETRLLRITRSAAHGSGAPLLAGLTATKLDDVSAPPDADRRVLERRINGLTMPRLLHDLRLYGRASQFPNLAQWLWRATGLLLAHPERCRDLVAVFKAPEMTDRGRARVLDVLVATGSSAAQTVLREILDSSEAHTSKRYGVLLQRLSLLTSPDTKTAAYLHTMVAQGEGAHTLAAAHSLGAVIGQRTRAGAKVDPRSAELLRDGLAAASTPRQQVGWLGTLGNAGLVEDVPLLARYANANDPLVRAAVPNALRKVQTPTSEKLLLDLAVDADRFVQERALQTFASYKLTPTHFDTLRSHVVSGELSSQNYGTLTTLLSRHRSESQAVLPVVQALLDRGVTDQRLLLRLRTLQRSLRSGS